MSHSHNLLNAVHDNRRRVKDLCRELNALADSLYAVGNSVLADKLDLISLHIEESEDKVYQAHGEYITGSLRDAEQRTGSLLALALAKLLPTDAAA